MFVDRARIKVIAGAGGNGCLSFRREKYVPRGGPNGGDGGNGGDVWFSADPRLTSLLDVRYHAIWKGRRGLHGQGKDCHGKNGETTLISVPPGTVIRDWDTREILGDLVEDEQRFCAAHGGRGGKGNARFATSTNRAPHFAENGEPGEVHEYLLELKLMADVGIVGLPNAGKSTFLARVSAAQPKIADYPFTTLSPNLGVANLSGYRSLVLADIPGIIEGAAQGKGLGHDFLRHIERTRILLFLIDPGDTDPIETRDILEGELASHSPVFAKRPHIFAFSKADIPENCERFREAHTDFENPFLISSATGEGIDALLEALWEILDRLRREEPEVSEDEESVVEYRYVPPFTVSEEAGAFRVEGTTVVRAIRMTDFSNEDAVLYLHSRLQKMGLFKTLKRLGAKDGQSILIADVELEYQGDS